MKELMAQLSLQAPRFSKGTKLPAKLRHNSLRDDGGGGNVANGVRVLHDGAVEVLFLVQVVAVLLQKRNRTMTSLACTTQRQAGGAHQMGSVSCETAGIGRANTAS
jgi:hypothetical protein